MRSVVVVAACVAMVACGSSGSGGGGGDGSSSSGGSSSSSSSGGGATTLGQPEQGVATYYAATGDGACGFGPSPGNLDVAAMDQPEWGGSAVCGECVAVTGPKGSVTVRIVDLCPECEAGHLDLSQQAFGQIADLSAGNVPITWQVVSCVVSGNVTYQIKDGSSQYWTAIQVRNSRLPVAKLEWLQSGAWTDVARADYDYFVVASGVGPGSYQVRITSAQGATLQDTLPPVQAGALVQGSGQF
ncbi:MAG: expansin EXLX1 family cellulose-binding protein [Polyangiaceae bacterium]